MAQRLALVSSYNATKSFHCWHFQLLFTIIYAYIYKQVAENFSEHKFEAKTQMHLDVMHVFTVVNGLEIFCEKKFISEINNFEIFFQFFVGFQCIYLLTLRIL